MKQSIRKILSMVLACAVIIGLCSGLAVSAQETLTLAAKVEGARVPAGEKQVVTVSGVPSGATSVAIYKAENGAKTGAALATATPTDGTASLTVTLGKGENSFIAEATGDSSTVATSSVLELFGYYEKYGTNKWNIDFTGYEVKDHRWGYPYQSLYKGSSDTGLYGHVGTAKVDSVIPAIHNVMEVADTNDTTHGSALKLSVNDQNSVQFNNFTADVAVTDAVRLQWDFKLKTASNDWKTRTLMVPYTNAGSTVLLTLTDKNDKTYFKCETVEDKEFQTGEWYRIVCYVDTKGNITYFINGELYNVHPTSRDTSSGLARVGLELKGKGAVAWIDNFKVDAVTLSDEPNIFTLASNAADVKAPVGAKVNLTASDLETGASTVVFYSTDAAGANKTKLAEATVANLKASAACTLTGVNNYFVAEALDDSGYVVGRSKVFNQVAYYEKTTTTKWDIDFEGYEMKCIKTTTSAPIYSDYRLYKDDAAVTSGSDNLTGRIFPASEGEQENTFAVESTGDSQHGYALKLTANNEKGINLNEFYARPTGDLVKYEWDYKVDSLPTDTAKDFSVMRPIAGSDWTPGLFIMYDSSTASWRFKMNGGSSFGPKVETNTWYHTVAYVGTNSSMSAYYVDDVFVDSKVPSNAYTSAGGRLASEIKVPGVTAWIDNFKVTAVERTQSASLSVKYEIGDSEVSAMAEGNLKVTPTIANYSDVKNVLCAVAVYEGDTLKTVKLCSKTFASDEHSYTPTALELGTVAATDTVKVMLWEADTLKPLCAPSELGSTAN